MENLNEQSNRIKQLFGNERLWGNLIKETEEILSEGNLKKGRVVYKDRDDSTANVEFVISQKGDIYTIETSKGKRNPVMDSSGTKLRSEFLPEIDWLLTKLMNGKGTIKTSGVLGVLENESGTIEFNVTPVDSTKENQYNFKITQNSPTSDAQFGKEGKKGEKVGQVGNVKVWIDKKGNKVAQGVNLFSGKAGRYGDKAFKWSEGSQDMIAKAFSDRFPDNYPNLTGDRIQALDAKTKKNKDGGEDKSINQVIIKILPTKK